MVNSCSASLCTSRGKTFKFHKFPLNDPELLKKWISITGRTYFKPSRSSVLCSKHFLASDYLNTTTDGTLIPKCRLRKQAIPSIPTKSFHLNAMELKDPLEIHEKTQENGSERLEFDLTSEGSNGSNENTFSKINYSPCKPIVIPKKPTTIIASTQTNTFSQKSEGTQANKPLSYDWATQTIPFRTFSKETQAPEVKVETIFADHSYVKKSEEHDKEKEYRKEISNLKKQVQNCKAQSAKLNALMDELIITSNFTSDEAMKKNLSDIAIGILQHEQNKLDNISDSDLSDTEGIEQGRIFRLNSTKKVPKLK